MPREILKTYRQVLDDLASLPPVKAGMVRVFRGQTKDHGSMRPTGLRKPLPRYGLWHTYAALIARDLKMQAAPNRLPDDQDGYEWAFLVSAIAQHYGPGSNFLDVTSSLEVAIWFALHDYEPFDISSISGPPGPLDPASDVVTRGVGVRYPRSSGDAGWLYVLDVPRMDGGRVHGALLDLGTTPEVFSNCPRIRAQKASLLWADPQVNAGDLSSFFVTGTPLRVQRPLDGAPRLDAPTDEIFPLPSRDPWYARFIGVPKTWSLNEDGKSCRFARPLEIVEYFPDELPERAVKEFDRRAITVSPHLVHRAALDNEIDPIAPIAWESGPPSRLADATPIYVEAPICIMRPPIMSGLWNDGLLVTDLDATAESLDLTDAGRKPVSLENVFIEFSPLEKVGWERVEESGAQPMELLRGAWLARRGGLIALQLIFQTLPVSAIRTMGPVMMKYDPARKRLRYWESGAFGADVINPADAKAFHDVMMSGGPGRDPTAIAAVEQARRRKAAADAVTASLTLLRDLSKPWKPSPYPVGLSRLGGRMRAYVRALPQACELVTNRDARGYHFVRLRGAPDPYSGQGQAIQWESDGFDTSQERDLVKGLGPTLALELPGPFADVPAESLRSAIASAVQAARGPR